MKTTHTLKNLSLIIIMFLCHFQAKAQISSEFYGITSSSGEQKLFRTDSIGQNTETVMEFKDYYGENGTAGLVDNGSGRMFGLTVDGGTGNLAVGGLYEFQVLSDEFNLLVEFDTVPGDYPRGKLVLNNTDLYGVTSQGGANNVGVLFVYNYVSGVYTKLHDFAATTGGVPESGMILNNQGNLMGMTYYGGANNQGVIYEYNLTTNTYQVIHSFDGANGANPVGRLLSASNGKYYGLTFNGGTSNNGVAFSLNNGVYTKHYDFTYADAVSAPPGGSFVEHPNGNLYATTGFGNSFGQTSLFKFDTTTNTCSAIYDVQPFSDDIKAFDTEVVLHSNGLIYGCVSPGDNLISSPTIFSSGSMVYSYDPIADTLQVLSHIQNKHASALTEGYNSDLYGVTLGVSGAFNPFLGSPISKLFSFDVSAGSVNDHFTWPEKFGTELMYYMLDGPGGSMYGISFNGGANHTGTIFEYNAHTNTRSVLSDFQSNLVLFDNEFDDPGKFIKAGNKMFILNRFRLFSYSSGLSGLTLEHDFIPATGKQEEKITAGLDGNVYGHTRFGGTNNRGVIFRFNVVTSTYEVLRNFVDVASDKSPFCEVEPGVFYYTKMPNSGAHALYEYNSNTDVLTQKHVFTSMTDPYAQVIKAVNGKLYGFAMQGGSSGNGGVYEYDYQNDLYTEVVNLPTSLASTGTENVTFTEGVNQKLYAFQQGSKEVIEYDPLTNVATFNPTPYVPEGGGRSTGLIRNDFCANAYDSTSVVSCVPYIAPNGNTYSVSGSYTETISGVNLCGGDSIVTINLTILPSSTNTDVQSACDSYTWIDGNTYTSSNNTAQYVVPNAIGCDSIITLDLTINSFTTSVDQQTACNSYTWIDGNTYTSSNNTATFILPNQQGCDSIITLDLTLNEVAVSVSYTGIGALVATAPAAQTFQWVNCDSNYAEIPGETSLLYLPSTNGNYAVVVTDGSCTDTSACFTVADAGLEDDLNSNIRLYPNPTNDIITIQSSFVIDAIEVYSLTGELLFRSENENQVDLSSFANGSYLFKIQSGESISLQKVVKN